MSRTVVYTGSFDPITRGHEEIIKKASRLFDTVYVVTCVNTNKKSSFTINERVEMLKKVTAKYSNVIADSYEGLAVDYARKVKAIAMIRGVRNAKDFDDEISQYYFNHKIDKNIETIVLMPDVHSLYISSSAIKELAAFNQDFSKYVPSEICEEIKARLCK